MAFLLDIASFQLPLALLDCLLTLWCVLSPFSSVHNSRAENKTYKFASVCLSFAVLLPFGSTQSRPCTSTLGKRLMQTCVWQGFCLGHVTARAGLAKVMALMKAPPQPKRSRLNRSRLPEGVLSSESEANRRNGRWPPGSRFPFALRVWAASDVRCKQFGCLGKAISHAKFQFQAAALSESYFLVVTRSLSNVIKIQQILSFGG